MISKFTIGRILDESRIDEVVGEFVILKKRGSSLIGNCPFHNEKTPSFNVSVTKGIYKCFGCGKAGNSVNFLMENQQMSYVDALKYLAKKYNIEIEEDHSTPEQKKEEEEKHSQQESILIANSAAQKFYTNYMLQSDEGKIGLAYFYERGFDKQTIEKFQLGFSPDNFSAFTDQAISQGFKLEVLKSAGLTSSKENSRVDFFRNRVMFPIHNMIGKVVGFGGRILKKDEKSPKYVNTPESEVYNKSKILYGLFFAKNSIRKANECLLVEGYTDVISLSQAGVENVVSSSGTSLTLEQIKLIKRITTNITVVYDGDAAGLKAALRGTDMILEEGLHVRVVLLPDSEDPDSYVKKLGETAFSKYIQENKKDIILFKMALYADEAKNDPIRKADLIKDMVASIAKIPDMIQRSVYVKECADKMSISEQILIVEVNKIRRQKAKKETQENIDPVGEMEDEASLKPIHHEQLQTRQSPVESMERDLAQLLMECSDWEILLPEQDAISVAKFIIEEIEGLPFQTIYKLILDEVQQNLEKEIVLTAPDFINHENEEIRKIASDLLVSQHELSPGWWRKYEINVPDKKSNYTKEIHSALFRFKQFHVLKRIEELETLMKVETDEEKQLKYLRLHQALMQQKKEFQKETGTVVYRPDLN